MVKKIFLCCFSFLVLQGFSQDSLTLEQAIKKTLEQNFSIQMVQNQHEIARIHNTWKNTGGIPLLRFTGTAAQNFITFADDPADDAVETGNTTNADYTQQNLSAQIALHWTIFDGFSARIQKEKLDYLEQLAEGNVYVLIETSLYATMLAYYNVIVQQQKLEVFSHILDLSRDRYQYQQSLQNVGVATTFEVLQARNAWLQDTAQFVQQQSLYNAAVRDLKYYMADTGDETYIFPDRFEPQNVSFNKNELKQRVSQHNIEVQNTYVQMAILEQEQKLVRSKYLPNLSFQTGAAYTYNSNDYGIVDPVQTQQQRVFANLSLQYDIYTGGARARASQISEIQIHTKKLELKDMLMRIYHELEREYEMYNSRKALYVLALQQERAAKLNYDLAHERFISGTISSLDFRTIQLQYLQSSVLLVEARYQNILSELNIFRLTGSIIKDF